MVDASTRDDLVADTIREVMAQVPTLEVEDIRIEHDVVGGAVAKLRVRGREHEVICELDGDGRLLSARVIEL